MSIVAHLIEEVIGNSEERGVSKAQIFKHVHVYIHFIHISNIHKLYYICYIFRNFYMHIFSNILH